MKTALIVFLVAFALSGCITGIMIPLLRKIKAGQPVSGYVKEHAGKNGTPTMGGLCFILPSVAAACFFLRGDARVFALSATITGAYLAVGFLDDFLKIRYRHNEGLRPWQKIVFQLAIALIGAAFAVKNGLSFLYLPFTKKVITLPEIAVFLLFVFVFLSVTNSVNLTDGLDGLAGSVSAIYLFVSGTMILLEAALFGGSDELRGLSTLSFALSGGTVGFLLYNSHPAKLFMGDTGSMALGGAIGAISLFSGNALVIPVLGITYVLSSISVIVQVLWYKRTGKRVFLMAPFHHHLEMKGVREEKIVFYFAAATLCLGMLLLLPLLT